MAITEKIAIYSWAPRKIAGCDDCSTNQGILGHESQGLVLAGFLIFRGALKLARMKYLKLDTDNALRESELHLDLAIFSSTRMWD